MNDNANDSFLNPEETSVIRQAFQLPPHPGPMDVPGYESLANILACAYSQSARGKGKVRHGNDLPFDHQPMQQEADAVGPGFILGQARKKIRESLGLPSAHAEQELLGAIVYTAGAILWLRNNPGKWPGGSSDE